MNLSGELDTAAIWIAARINDKSLSCVDEEIIFDLAKIALLLIEARDEIYDLEPSNQTKKQSLLARIQQDIKTRWRTNARMNPGSTVIAGGKA